MAEGVELEEADVAVAAYREEDAWVALPLDRGATASLDGIVAALRQLPAPAGALALASYDEDFLLLVRVQGATVRLLISDATASEDWAVAADVVDALGVDEEDLGDDEPEPAGDHALLADLGLPRRALEAIIEDPDLYPDEILARIAAGLGFGEQYEQAAQMTD